MNNCQKNTFSDHLVKKDPFVYVLLYMIDCWLWDVVDCMRHSRQGREAGASSRHIQKGLFVTKPAEIDLPAGRHRISLLLIGSICLGDVTVELEEGK